MENIKDYDIRLKSTYVTRHTESKYVAHEEIGAWNNKIKMVLELLNYSSVIGKGVEIFIN